MRARSHHIDDPPPVNQTRRFYPNSQRYISDGDPPNVRRLQIHSDHGTVPQNTPVANDHRNPGRDRSLHHPRLQVDGAREGQGDAIRSSALFASTQIERCRDRKVSFQVDSSSSGGRKAKGFSTPGLRSAQITSKASQLSHGLTEQSSVASYSPSRIVCWSCRRKPSFQPRSRFPSKTADAGVVSRVLFVPHHHPLETVARSVVKTRTPSHALASPIFPQSRRRRHNGSLVPFPRPKCTGWPKSA